MAYGKRKIVRTKYVVGRNWKYLEPTLLSAPYKTLENAEVFTSSQCGWDALFLAKMNVHFLSRMRFYKFDEAFCSQLGFP